MRRRGWIRSALVGVTAVTLLTACSGQPDNASNATREPAAPAVAPSAAAAPAGEVSASAPISLLLDEPTTGVLAAVVDSGATLHLIDKGVTRSVALPGKAAALVAGKPGEVVIAMPGKIVRVDVASGALTTVSVEGDLHSVAVNTDGSLVAGLADGRVLLLDADGAVRHTITGLSAADAIDARDGSVVVLDRRQSAIVQLDGTAKLGLALRAGDGAAMMIGDHFGRRLVTDTDGAELLVYTADPLVLHQRFPVGSSPYALAYDQRSETVWVTLTGSNEVVGYELSTGIPVEVGRYPTVRQPNSATVDARTGDLFVGSATGDGLQRIGADQRKRGQ